MLNAVILGVSLFPCPTGELTYYSHLTFAKFPSGSANSWIQAAGQGVDWKPSPDD